MSSSITKWGRHDLNGVGWAWLVLGGTHLCVCLKAPHAGTGLCSAALWQLLPPAPIYSKLHLEWGVNRADFHTVGIKASGVIFCWAPLCLCQVCGDLKSLKIIRSSTRWTRRSRYDLCVWLLPCQISMAWNTKQELRLYRIILTFSPLFFLWHRWAVLISSAADAAPLSESR